MADGLQQVPSSDNLEAPQQGGKHRDNIKVRKGSMGDLQGCYAVEDFGQRPALTVVGRSLDPILIFALASRLSGS